MHRLCDEVIQLIFYELSDPSPLTLVSQRFYRFSQDPYVRAHYFLIHYGPTEAMYYALGRGKIITERVLDILLTSGAHLSRYLIQIAIHHYFHTQAHFIKSPWVRNVPLRVFAYFLKLAEEKYGEIPRGKGEDDGSVFANFLKESRFPPHLKSITWENVKEIMDTYKFIPFCSRDPIMAQFPLALAIEPRLLPHAVANGFSMDYKYRNFVFRKMFERPTLSSETHADDIVDNVKQLCKLDPTMFVSRTVAAEICMEAKMNDIGYAALKQLDKAGLLRFELSTLVEDLLRTFLSTRSICSVATGETLVHLFTDFPSTDVAVRLVILIVIFVAADNLHMPTSAIHRKLENLGLTPLTRRDAYNVLINPFVERYHSVREYAQDEIGFQGDGAKGMNSAEIESLMEEVGARCLEIGCKGRLLKRIYESYPTLKALVSRLVLRKYHISLEDVPSWEDGSCHAYVAPLCRDFMRYGVGPVHSLESLLPEECAKESMDTTKGKVQDADSDGMESPLYEDSEDYEESSTSELGGITQESLTTMIRHDEVAPVRSRRRMMYSYGHSEMSGRLRYPHDPLHVGRWAKSQFGVKSSVIAVFMTHAVINENSNMLHHYLMYADGNQMHPVGIHVPITLKHFKILARLGRMPNSYLYHEIEIGAEFYMDEDDYIAKDDAARILEAKHKVKVEATPNTLPSSSSPTPAPAANRGKKRPRRSAAVTVRSYAVPGSDDEAIAEEDSYFWIDDQEKKKCKETNLQLWIKHLSAILKSETRKYTEIKKRLEKSSEADARVRIHRNEFVKSLTTNLRNLRKLEVENRVKFYGYEDVVEDYSDDDDYMARRTKERKAAYLSL